MSSPERAPTPVDPTLSDRVIAIAREVEAAQMSGQLAAISPQALQAMLSSLSKLYGANVEAGNSYPVLAGPQSVSGTDVLILCGAMLKAADLQVFELGMWQSWTGR
ncbi:MAG: hypothetical protein K2X62_07830 [Beijerinckiaceae bacterium]|jgi:hypothetical protein|nr:hypothetical protein [Beijerinckiaceae bacterium]MDO9439412.1 hypothetical protein [Beijerinckiaceae bacterium]